ncbi:MAG: hypothetical protein U5K36_12490 [Roseovarius sp.]|nr:hypothetical protein [Roseovarius sp.]
MAPAILVLLLGVRVATAAAVECQHELADAAHAAERAQEALRAETLALGGELCLYATGDPAETAQQDGAPHLTSPCPFFKSPLALAGIVTDATARIVSFSPLAPVTSVPASDAQAPRAAYSPRAPPRVALG